MIKFLGYITQEFRYNLHLPSTRNSEAGWPDEINDYIDTLDDLEIMDLIMQVIPSLRHPHTTYLHTHTHTHTYMYMHAHSLTHTHVYTHTHTHTT